MLRSRGGQEGQENGECAQPKNPHQGIVLAASTWPVPSHGPCHACVSNVFPASFGEHHNVHARASLGLLILWVKCQDKLLFRPLDNDLHH